MLPQARVSNVEIGDIECIFLNELAARLNHIAHQFDENIVSLNAFLDAHLQQGTRIAIKGRFPKLLRIHFSEAFVALHLADALLARSHDGIDQRAGACGLRLIALAHIARRLAKNFLQLSRMLGQNTPFGRTSKARN